MCYKYTKVHTQVFNADSLMAVQNRRCMLHKCHHTIVKKFQWIHTCRRGRESRPHCEVRKARVLHCRWGSRGQLLHEAWPLGGVQGGQLRSYLSSAETPVTTMTWPHWHVTILHPAEPCACTSMTKYPWSLDTLGSSTQEKGLVKVMRLLNLRYFEQRDVKVG